MTVCKGDNDDHSADDDDHQVDDDDHQVDDDDQSADDDDIRWIMMTIRWMTMSTRWITMTISCIMMTISWIIMTISWILMTIRWMKMIIRWITMTLFAILPKPEFDMDSAEKDETKERLKQKHAELGKHNNCCDNLRQFPGQKVVTCSITAKYFVEIHFDSEWEFICRTVVYV